MLISQNLSEITVHLPFDTIITLRFCFCLGSSKILYTSTFDHYREISRQQLLVNFLYYMWHNIWGNKFKKLHDFLWWVERSTIRCYICRDDVNWKNVVVSPLVLLYKSTTNNGCSFDVIFTFIRVERIQPSSAKMCQLDWFRSWRMFGCRLGWINLNINVSWI